MSARKGQPSAIDSIIAHRHFDRLMSLSSAGGILLGIICMRRIEYFNEIISVAMQLSSIFIAALAPFSIMSESDITGMIIHHFTKNHFISL